LEYTYSQPYVRKGKEYITDVFTDEAVNFIKKHKDRPFFLQLAYSAPHRPLEAPEKDIAQFRDIKGITPGVAVVYAMIKKLDEGVGKVLKAAKELGLEKDTIVLFVSDNGPDFVSRNGLSPLRDSGFNGHKGDVLEGGIRVPGIIKWPGKIKAGTKSHEIIHFTDWMPTLLCAAGIRAGKGLDMDGRDVSDILFCGKNNKREPLYWQWSRYRPVEKSNAAVRMGKWKLYYPPAPNSLQSSEIESIYDKEVYRKTFKILSEAFWEKAGARYKPMLFDLEEDPGEKRNLSGEYPDLTRKMADMLGHWYGKVTKELKEKTKLTLVDE
jgi:arylsulfatase A